MLPGPVDRARFLGLEIEAGALSGAKGVVKAVGRQGARESRQPQARRLKIYRDAAPDLRSCDRLARSTHSGRGSRPVAALQHRPARD